MLLNEDIRIEHWLAIMRIVIGLWWLKSVWHKEYPKFVKTGMIGWTNGLLDNHPVPAVASALRPIINFNPTVFPYLIVLGELAVGIGVTFGFLTPISLLVAINLNVIYLITAGVKPKDITINNCFRVEQGQNIVMIVSELVLFAASGWAVWSVDAELDWFMGSLI